VIRPGSSPVGCTDACPTTLQEAKPKAGSRRGRGDHVSDRRRESKPRSRRRNRPRSTAFFDHVCSNRRPINPTKINRVGRAARTARGPGQTVMSLNGLAAALVRRDHPLTGSNLRRAEPQERRRTRSAFRRKPDARGKNRSSGWAARQPEHAGSGTPRQRTRRCMTRLGRRDRQWQGSIGWVRHERASASVTPTTPAWRIEDDATHPR
jgi:hypothetical protein